MANEVKLIADSIVYAVQNQKQKLTSILLKNGVVVPSGTSDAELIMLVSDVFKKSKPFRNDFLNMISSSEYVSSSFEGYSNFTFDEFKIDESLGFKPTNVSTLTGSSILTKDSVLNSVPTLASTSNPLSPKTSFWTTSNIVGLLNKASDTYVATSTNKANIALAEAAKARAEAGMPDNYTGGTSNVNQSKSNTILYVVLAIAGIGILGGAVWYMSKSKK